MEITSPAFSENERIPSKYTCDGEDINPPLEILGVPSTTKSLVLIMDDPDAPNGTFTHWVVWNIPPETSLIREDFIPINAIQGLNDFKKNKYNGPCPPPGTHRYFFKIYSINVLLNLPLSSTKKDLEKAMKGHIIENAELIGLYSRGK